LVDLFAKSVLAWNEQHQQGGFGLGRAQGFSMIGHEQTSCRYCGTFCSKSKAFA
jgi:hypothetical protein